jgi:adenylate cyclase class IV
VTGDRVAFALPRSARRYSSSVQHLETALPKTETDDNDYYENEKRNFRTKKEEG